MRAWRVESTFNKSVRIGFHVVVNGEDDGRFDFFELQQELLQAGLGGFVVVARAAVAQRNRSELTP